MHIIDFDIITKPTPDAYDAAYPTRQQENYYYVLNQIIGQLSGTMNLDIAEEIGGLAVEGSTFELPGLKVTRSGRVVSLVLTP